MRDAGPNSTFLNHQGRHAIESLREALYVTLWMRRIGTDHYRPRLVQVCTGPEDASQHDSFLPQCPITYRKVVIPTGYNGRHQTDSSHRVLVEKVLRGFVTS